MASLATTKTISLEHNYNWNIILRKLTFFVYNTVSKINIHCRSLPTILLKVGLIYFDAQFSITNSIFILIHCYSLINCWNFKHNEISTVYFCTLTKILILFLYTYKKKTKKCFNWFIYVVKAIVLDKIWEWNVKFIFANNNLVTAQKVKCTTHPTTYK